MCQQDAALLRGPSEDGGVRHASQTGVLGRENVPDGIAKAQLFQDRELEVLVSDEAGQGVLLFGSSAPLDQHRAERLLDGVCLDHIPHGGGVLLPCAEIGVHRFPVPEVVGDDGVHVP